MNRPESDARLVLGLHAAAREAFIDDQRNAKCSAVCDRIVELFADEAVQVGEAIAIASYIVEQIANQAAEAIGKTPAGAVVGRCAAVHVLAALAEIASYLEQHGREPDERPN